MRIGRLQIRRVARDPLGRPLHHWEEVTLDQLSDQSRKLITKMARVAARDFLEGQREEFMEQIRAELATPHADAPPEPAAQPEGTCVLCHAELAAHTSWTAAGAGWVHTFARDCHTTAGRGVCGAPRGQACRFNQMGDGACVYDTDCFPTLTKENDS